MKTGKKLWRKAISLALVCVMAVSVLALAVPEQASAASALSFKGKGKSTVSISDTESIAGTVYIKFQPKVTGYVTLKVANNSTQYSYATAAITLCNKNKKAITQADERYSTYYSNDINYTRTYGVKKDVTYYFAVKSSGGIKVTATVKSAAKGSNTTKNKAKTLEKGKTVSGVIVAGDKTAYWYKLKLTSSSRIRVQASARMTGTAYGNGIRFSFLNSKGKLFVSNASWSLSNYSGTAGGMQFYRSYTSGAVTGLETGTYYVKVERTGKTSSGAYTLKWTTY